jgi:hypothetical protein
LFDLVIIKLDSLSLINLKALLFGQVVMWQKILRLCWLLISSSYAADCAKGSHSELQVTHLNEQTKTYLVRGIAQTGAWLPLVAIFKL